MEQSSTLFAVKILSQDFHIRGRSIHGSFIFAFLVSLLFCAWSVVTVDPCKAGSILTLEQGVSEALSANWSLKTYRERIAQAGYALSQARTGFLPSFSTSYGYTRFGDPMTQKIQAGGIFGASPIELQVGTQDNYQWKGTITQPVFTGFAILSRYELSKLGIDQAELEYQLARLDLMLNVKEAYFGILQADKGVDVGKRAVESLEAHVKTADNFYKVGMIPVNDLLKAQVELGNASHDLVRAQNVSTLARALMNSLLARPVEAALEIEDILEYRPADHDFDQCLKRAFEKRPEIALIAVNIMQADQGVRLARSKMFPQVSLNWEYIKEGDGLEVDGSPYHEPNRWDLMVGATWTFWEWGRTHYEIKQNESARYQLNDTLNSLKDKIRLEVRRAVLGLEEAEKKIPISKKAVEQAEENLRVSEERYKAKVATSTEVLDAQTLLTQARTNYYRALYEHKLAQARLQRSMGSADK